MRYDLAFGVLAALLVGVGAARTEDARSAIARSQSADLALAPVLLQPSSRSGLSAETPVASEFDLLALGSAIGLAPEAGPAARRFGRVQMRFESWATTDPWSSQNAFASQPIAFGFPAQAPGAPTPVIAARPIALVIEPDARVVTLSYSRALTARAPLGFDVSVEPRLKAVRARDVEGLGGGALLRIGRDIADALEADGPVRGMHLFVGADTQALSWRPGAGAVQLRDQMIVGDAQAGVGWRFGRADVAVGLMHREIKYQGATKREQFGGVSLVMRR